MRWMIALCLGNRTPVPLAGIDTVGMKILVASYPCRNSKPFTLPRDLSQLPTYSRTYCNHWSTEKKKKNNHNIFRCDILRTYYIHGYISAYVIHIYRHGCYLQNIIWDIYNIIQPLKFVIWLGKRVITIKNEATFITVLFQKINMLLKLMYLALFVVLCKELKLHSLLHPSPCQKL
jgi:hypothetical protein